jgi:hypothetical protein
LTDLIGLRLAAFTLQIDLLFYPGFAKDVMAPSNAHFKAQVQEQLAKVIKSDAASEVPLSTRCSVLPVPMAIFYTRMILKNDSREVEIVGRPITAGPGQRSAPD